MKFQKAYEKTIKPKIDTGDGLTEQSHKNLTDINLILKDYKQTGVLKHAQQNAGKYDDITVSDFQEAMFKVKHAQNLFDALPGDVRKRFGNNPENFLEFVQNPANKDEMAAYGMLKGNDGIDFNGNPVMSPRDIAPEVSSSSEANAQPEGAK